MNFSQEHKDMHERYVHIFNVCFATVIYSSPLTHICDCVCDSVETLKGDIITFWK